MPVPQAVKYVGKKQTAACGAGLVSSPPHSRDTWRVLSLGQFFFVKIWAGSDLVSVAELQLLWEDKAGQPLIRYVTDSDNIAVRIGLSPSHD